MEWGCSYLHSLWWMESEVSASDPHWLPVRLIQVEYLYYNDVISALLKKFSHGIFFFISKMYVYWGISVHCIYMRKCVNFQSFSRNHSYGQTLPLPLKLTRFFPLVILFSYRLWRMNGSPIFSFPHFLRLKGYANLYS